MNGRLYDPLLRRFLNADENIQAPHNTQNYNKYGYVMNNPLMYSDPNGEFAIIPFLFKAFKFISLFITGMNFSRTTTGFFNGTISFGAFAKSIITIAASIGSGEIGGIFKGGGFWATVGNGALVGAGSGGVNAIINGQNFLEGLVKGAVIGGAVAGVTWVVSKTVAYYNSKKPSYITSNELNEAGFDTSDSGYNDYYTSDTQVQNDFNRTTGDYQASVDNINTEYKVATSQNLPEGTYLTNRNQIWTDNPKEAGYVVGLTVGRNKNWWEFMTKGAKSTVLIAPNLGLKSDFVKQAVFGHEYIHAYHRYIGLMSQYGKNYSNYTESSAYHFTINLLKTRGQDFSSFFNQFYNYGGSFPGSFNWTYAIKNIVNFKK